VSIDGRPTSFATPLDLSSAFVTHGRAELPPVPGPRVDPSGFVARIPRDSRRSAQIGVERVVSSNCRSGPVLGRRVMGRSGYRCHSRIRDERPWPVRRPWRGRDRGRSGAGHLGESCEEEPYGTDILTTRASPFRTARDGYGVSDPAHVPRRALSVLKDLHVRRRSRFVLLIVLDTPAYLYPLPWPP
jgi:hypothetical protein